MEEEKMQTFQLNQNGQDYILTTGIIDDSVRISVQENLSLTCPCYGADFSLSELCSINKYFTIVESIDQANAEINKAIERQKAGLQIEGKIIKLIIYMTIGTTKTNLIFPLTKRDPSFVHAKPIAPMPENMEILNFEKTGNYPEDALRISTLEDACRGMSNGQKNLNTDIEKLIEQTRVLLNDTYILKEDNAKLRERLRQVKEINKTIKNEIIDLRNEDTALRQENRRLLDYYSKYDRILKDRKEAQIKALKEYKSQEKRDDNAFIGPLASTVKFEKPQVQTFISRSTVSPSMQVYDENNLVQASKAPFRSVSIQNK